MNVTQLGVGKRESQVGLFLPFVLALYLAAPLYQIPFVGVSFSLPLILLLVAFNRKFGLPNGTPFAVFLMILLGAIVASFAVNYINGKLENDIHESIKYIIQFCFYVVAAALAYHLFLHPTFPSRCARAFSLGVAVMSAVVLLETLAYGSLNSTGGWSRLTRMSQNGYAVQFSCYLPFVYYGLISSRRLDARSLWAIIGCICLFAVMVNGSRTAWGTTLLTLVLFAGVYSFALRRYKAAALGALLVPVFLITGWTLVPESLKGGLTKDFYTIDNLENDKSWMIRQLQIQKSMQIFDDSPWFGVGPGQYRNQSIALDMPDVLAGRHALQFSDVSAHNSYIQFLSECGLVFLVPFVLMLGWLVISGVRAATMLARRGEVWSISLVVGLVGLSVHFWTISGLTTTGPWFIYGAMAGTIKRARILNQRCKLNQRGNEI